MKIDYRLSELSECRVPVHVTIIFLIFLENGDNDSRDGNPLSIDTGEGEDPKPIIREAHILICVYLFLC